MIHWDVTATPIIPDANVTKQAIANVTAMLKKALPAIMIQETAIAITKLAVVDAV